MKKQYFLPMLIIGVLVVALASYCSKGSSYGSSSNNNNNTPANNNTVTMKNMSFSITSLTVKAGTTVTWTNNDNTTHTVTADNDSFNSGDIKAGYSFTKTFNAQGTFAYHCTYHSTMKATVIVN
jgi:plastocyanin